MSLFMARELNNHSAEVAVKEVKTPGTKEVILVDKDGNETTTTEAFYNLQKDQFETAGLKKK